MTMTFPQPISLKRVWATCLVTLFLFSTPLFSQEIPARAALIENGAYAPVVAARIAQAKRSVICAYFLFKITDKPGNLPRGIAAELIKAARRGVEVTVILDGGREVGKQNLVAARVLSRGGARVLFSRGRTTHAKALAIDDRYVVIGSHNLTQSALRHNNELSVLLDSPELALQVRRYLEEIKY